MRGLRVVLEHGPPPHRWRLARVETANLSCWQTAGSDGGDMTQDDAQTIDTIIEQLGDWRGETLSSLRALIREALPDVVETTKWQKKATPLGVPVWEHGGILCTGETYKDKVKLTFMHGAEIEDPAGLFNSGLDGNQRRVIDLHEGDALDAEAFKALVSAAAERNAA
jgi:hypothetical protein